MRFINFNTSVLVTSEKEMHFACSECFLIFNTLVWYLYSSKIVLIDIFHNIHVGIVQQFCNFFFIIYCVISCLSDIRCLLSFLYLLKKVYRSPKFTVSHNTRSCNTLKMFLYPFFYLNAFISLLSVLLPIWIGKIFIKLIPQGTSLIYFFP